MSELLKSHDSFVLRKPPHAQISRPNWVILSHNETKHPRVTQTLVRGHTQEPFATENRRVSPEKIGGHFVEACAEKKRDACDRFGN